MEFMYHVKAAKMEQADITGGPSNAKTKGTGLLHLVCVDLVCEV